MKLSHFTSFISNNQTKILLLSFLLIISILLRFYNLDWGSPIYFHPDERNIASSIVGLHFPDQLNPHFFAYGSLPIYTTYFTGYVLHTLSHCSLGNTCTVSFEESIIILRIISATFSVLIVLLSYIVGERLKRGAGLLTATLSTFSVGYIQFAHFGTFETILTFFSLLLFFLLLNVLKEQKKILFLFTGIVLGVLISIKVSSIVLFILPLITFLMAYHGSMKKKIILSALQTLFVIVIAALVYILTNPYVLLDTLSFKGSMDYEGGVVLGTVLVFYTGEFFKTIPGLFQFSAIYPFLLNPVTTTFFLCALVSACYSLIQKRDKQTILLLLFFFVLFLPQAVLFAKWTRYMLPTLPFMYLLISLFLIQMKNKKIRTASFALITMSSVLFGISYFTTVFIEKNSLQQAADFAGNNIPRNAIIMSEVYDLGVIPFNKYLPNITLYNFYELDNHTPEYSPESLQAALERADYIILPSQRILKTRLFNATAFPVGHSFYSNLVEEKNGFRKIYETPCSLFCKITYLGDPLFRFEQTASVFDRPVVLLYKKQ